MADAARAQKADIVRANDLLAETLRSIIASKCPECPEELQDFAQANLCRASDIISFSQEQVGPPPKPVFAWVAYHPDWSGVAIFRDELDAYKHAVDQHMQVVGVREGGDPREAVARG